MTQKLLTSYTGEKLYEMSNHLGNVLTVINDIKVPYLEQDNLLFKATIVSTADYSPFGVQLDERTVSVETYRYGYQGSEKDDEVKGSGNSYTTYFRQLDPRLGRWLSIDPETRKLPWESPYISMGDNPICNNDIFGDKWKDPEKDGAKAKEIKTRLGNRGNELEKEGDKLASQAEEIFKKVNMKYEKTGKFNERKENKAFSKLDKSGDLYRQAGEMRKAVAEIDNLEKSDIEFTFKQITSADGLHYTYMNENGTVVIEYSSDEILVHELTHAHQHLTGELNYPPMKRPGGAYGWDITDEVKAYTRQYIFHPDSFRRNVPNSSQIIIHNYWQINSTWIRQIHTVLFDYPYAQAPENDSRLR